MTLPFQPYRIEARSDVMSGKPVIRGTRITVEMVLRRIADGYTVPELLEDWPHVTTEDIVAALRFAAENISRLNSAPA